MRKGLVKQRFRQGERPKRRFRRLEKFGCRTVVAEKLVTCLSLMRRRRLGYLFEAGGRWLGVDAHVRVRRRLNIWLVLYSSCLFGLLISLLSVSLAKFSVLPIQISSANLESAPFFSTSPSLPSPFLPPHFCHSTIIEKMSARRRSQTQSTANKKIPHRSTSSSTPSVAKPTGSVKAMAPAASQASQKPGKQHDQQG